MYNAEVSFLRVFVLFTEEAIDTNIEGWCNKSNYQEYDQGYMRYVFSACLQWLAIAVVFVGGFHITVFWQYIIKKDARCMFCWEPESCVN